jgi:hypothetical protein
MRAREVKTSVSKFTRSSLRYALLRLGFVVQGFSELEVFFARKVFDSKHTVLHRAEGCRVGIGLSRKAQACRRCSLFASLNDGLPVIASANACRAGEEGRLKLLLNSLLGCLLFGARCPCCSAWGSALGYPLQLPAHLGDARGLKASTLQQAEKLAPLLGRSVGSDGAEGSVAGVDRPAVGKVSLELVADGLGEL